MSTADNDVVNRMCASKRAYETLKDARTMRNYLERYHRKKGVLRIYKCPICELYHLTHTPLSK